MSHRYWNSDPDHRPHGAKAILRWGVWDPLIGRRKTAMPGPPAERTEPDLELIRESSRRPRLTWIGHASFLCQLDDSPFLIDPVFSRRVGLVYRRYGRPGLLPGQLPPLTAVLVSHNHYDHLDMPSLKALPSDVPVIVPAGLGRTLRCRLRQPVVELQWWRSIEVGGLEICLVPARHWSRRFIFDTNRTLWGGFVVKAGSRTVYHAGDTAWFDGFREIAQRFPDLLAAMLPIGGYEPPWFMEHNHLNPEQAGRAFEMLAARYLVPMHWGALQLTDEPLSEPAERLRAWWKEHDSGDGRSLAIPAVGETLFLDE